MKWHVLMSLIFTLGVLSTVSGADVKANVEKARVAHRLSDYEDIDAFIQSHDLVYVQKDTGSQTHYGLFETDENPQEFKAWEVYDLLYEDVPKTYLLGCQFLALGDYQQAKKMFVKCRKDKTPSKKVFGNTMVYKNYVPEKLLLCALGEGDDKEAEKAFQQIINNKQAHAYVRTSIRYVKYLVDHQRSGSQAQALAEELLKKKLPVRQKAELDINRCLAISLQKKYREAKYELDRVIVKYHSGVPEIEQLKDEALSTIVIYHEKNYRHGVNLFKDLLKKNRGSVSVATYVKLGDCYAELKKYEEARWNYLRAYNLEFKDNAMIKSIIGKVEEMNKHILPEEGNAAISQLLNKVKSTL